MPTLKDVAKETGLAVATVSRVLNNRGYISKETRDKVYTAMEKLNYQPNEVARSLSKQSSNIIGVVVPHLDHPYFAKLVSALERAAYTHHYKLLVFNSMYREDKEDEYLEICMSNRTAGVILCSGTVKSSKFRTTDVPLITLERYCEEGMASIECDNRQGGMLAAKHLIECGCQRIICFGDVAGMPMPADQRMEGISQICCEKKIAYYPVQVCRDDYFTMDYREQIGKVLDQYPEADGIFTGSDVIAAQVIQVCSGRGLRIPEDIMIVGFDDVNIAGLTTPAITTIRQPLDEMADTAISFIERIRKNQIVPRMTVLPVTLVERETTKNIR